MIQSKIKTLDDLATTVNNLKRAHKKIVFTNGCFDIIHAGHVTYLEKARQAGDYLVVGLNSDSSIRRLKGNSRPIVQESDRATVLAAIEAVSFVVIFNDDTPLNVIKKLLPDLLVKGGDWSIDKIVGGEVVLNNGGGVFNIPLLNSRSTTNIVEKIKQLPV